MNSIRTKTPSIKITKTSKMTVSGPSSSFSVPSYVVEWSRTRVKCLWVRVTPDGWETIVILIIDTEARLIQIGTRDLILKRRWMQHQRQAYNNNWWEWIKTPVSTRILSLISKVLQYSLRNLTTPQLLGNSLSLQVEDFSTSKEYPSHSIAF